VDHRCNGAATVTALGSPLKTVIIRCPGSRVIIKDKGLMPAVLKDGLDRTEIIHGDESDYP
jgi:hypothetical protein